MQSWRSVLQMVHDNISIIFFFLMIGVFVAGWLVFEAYRSQKSRDEVFRLRQRLYELERQRIENPATPSTDPVVLSTRWVRSGAAATTSDGGCLILVNRVSPQQQQVHLTLRVDGYAAAQGQVLRVGESLEVGGKSGIYIIELAATDKIQARIAVSLRNRHAEAAQ